MDCLEGMKLISSASVDMILCDLPYGTTQNKWDSLIPLEPMWDQYRRIIRPNGAIVLTAQMPFTITLGASNLSWLKYEWVWEKPQGTGFLNAKRYPLKSHENVLLFCSGTHTYNPQMEPGHPYTVRRKPTASKNYGKCEQDSEIVNCGFRYRKTVLRFGTERRGLHPTQKPVALFEYLIRTYTNPGELVLDNCMGSGTTAIACINTDRKYMGFELDATYFTKANDRIHKHREARETSHVSFAAPPPPQSASLDFLFQS